ncbi:MAG: hypothetical protein O3B24_07650 [Verrucomicrobia bacterium]|nr:hypothetical protein [Verrucomicrobiota bacterium]
MKLALRFPRPRIPWRLYPYFNATRKPILRFLLNCAHRRPFWSWENITTLHRLIDMRRVSPTAIPVVINNFNRLDSLRTLVDWVQSLEGEKAIVILDNASTFPPLRNYYRTLHAPNLQVVRLGYNSELEGIADVGRELRRFRRYVVTDPDLVPCPDTPRDILKRMNMLLDRYPQFTHVGASIEIRDIPATYPLREQVLAWESQYWPPRVTCVGDDGYDAWVDTTFGMYRGDSDVTKVYPAMRMPRPYTLKHVDWYLDPAQLTPEQRFYQRQARPVASWTQRLRDQPRQQR